MTAKKPSRMTKEIIESADDLRAVGIIDEATHEKITLRNLGDKAAPEAPPISGDEIRALRERAHVSQAVFARYLQVSVAYVSQIERGARIPTGPALVLLNVIRRKGLEAIL